MPPSETQWSGEEIRVRETVADRIEACTPIAVIANNAAVVFGIPVRAISAGGRREATVKARSMVCFQALEEGYSVTHIARYLGMSRNGVMVAAKRHPQSKPSNEISDNYGI